MYLHKDIRQAIYSQITNAEQLKQAAAYLGDVEILKMFNSVTELNEGVISVDLVLRLPRLKSIWNGARLNIQSLTDFERFRKWPRISSVRRLTLQGAGNLDNSESYQALRQLMEEWWTPDKSLSFLLGPEVTLDDGYVVVYDDIIGGTSELIQLLQSTIPRDYCRRLKTMVQSGQSNSALAWIASMTNLNHLNPTDSFPNTRDFLSSLPPSLEEVILTYSRIEYQWDSIKNLRLPGIRQVITDVVDPSGGGMTWGMIGDFNDHLFTLFPNIQLITYQDVYDLRTVVGLSKLPYARLTFYEEDVSNEEDLQLVGQLLTRSSIYHAEDWSS